MIPETFIGDGNNNTQKGVTYHVTSIGRSAFSGCSGLTSVIIPNGVTSIGNSAFSSCIGLTRFISNSPNYRVENDRYLIDNNSQTLIGYAPKDQTAATIPDSVTSIGESIFYDCSGLTSITVNKSQDSISGAPWGAKNATVNWNG